jgi:hypothetical protein
MTALRGVVYERSSEAAGVGADVDARRDRANGVADDGVDEVVVATF